ncbi:hypothetical protein Csa_000695 [Cucumis sativus]|uniref:Secreted protein n=1 Tax=Cucumis sativus TaxID=3659 RepID=A0A0A0KJR7_CUCSA|nr:hypothetical protein Csa_000695 [Cucumis sativus]
MAVLICLFATAQSGFLALIFATSPDKWKLQMGCKAFNRPIQGGVFPTRLVHQLQWTSFYFYVFSEQLHLER